MWSKKAIAQLDKYFPPAGGCMLCEFKDKRHRLWDAILDLDESDEFTARLYNRPVEAIKLVRKIRPYHKIKKGWIKQSAANTL